MGAVLGRDWAGLAHFWVRWGVALPPSAARQDTHLPRRSLCSPPDTSDLQFRARGDRLGGQPLFFERFPALWAGARSTHGATGGRVCFEAKVGAGRRGRGRGKRHPGPFPPQFGPVSHHSESISRQFGLLSPWG